MVSQPHVVLRHLDHRLLRLLRIMHIRQKRVEMIERQPHKRSQIVENPLQPGDPDNVLVLLQGHLLALAVGARPLHMRVEDLLDLVRVGLQLQPEQVQTPLPEVMLLHVQTFVVVEDELIVVLQNRHCVVDRLRVNAGGLGVQAAMSAQVLVLGPRDEGVSEGGHREGENGCFLHVGFH